MDTGMLWFDNDPKKSLDVKIQQAADYYRHKYGRSPDLCLVNPGSLAKSSPDQSLAASQGNLQSGALNGMLAIRPFRSVLPGHLWIGVDEKLPAGAD